MKDQLYFTRQRLYRQGHFEEAQRVQQQINNLTKQVFNNPINDK